jgi:mono/diheme cytochrome c family protein
VPAPVWLFVALALVGYWGFDYLETYGGGFSPQVYEPYASLAFIQTLQPKGEGDEVMAKGKKVYTLYCVACHQPSGLGAPGQFPPLAESEGELAEGPNRSIRVVLNGFQGPVEVKGQPFNGAMPPWGAVLKDEDVAAVLTYIRGNKEWKNDAKPVKPEQVKAIRDAVKSRSTTWSADELKAVPVKD